ncbi:MAG: MMPL family transporter, partial [Dehalococcoidia bacterium]
MFKKFGQIVYAIRWGILAAGVLLLVAGVLYGTGVFSRLKDGGFEDTSTQSFHAGQQLQRSLHISAADIVLLFHSDSLKAEDPRYASAVAETLGRLSGQANIDRIVSFYVTAAPSFVSNDGHDTYAIVTMTGTDDAKLKRYQELKPLLTSSVLQVRFGGVLPASAAISSQVSKDLGRAESITFPVTAVLLIIIFGGLVAASLPLAIGGLAILGAFITLRLLSNFTDISIFALNVVTMLGLGLAIDYSLFIVSRFREELPGHSAEAAVIRTLATAGRTVAFSAITVALSLASLLIFPQMFLRPMGLGGIAAVMVAMLGSLTVLPALLAVLGPRVDSLAVRRFLPFAARAGEGSEHQGIWYRIAQQVMRRPGIIAAVLVVALASAGIPFLGARFSTPDARALPAGNEARQVSAALVRDFPRDESSAVRVAVQTSGPALSGENIGALYDYTLRLRLLAHVKGIEGLTTVGPQLDRAGYQAEYSQPNANPQQAAAVAAFAQGNLTEVSVFSDVPSQSSAGQSLVKAIRALPPPTGARVEVAGESASLVDLLHSLTLHIPAALALIVVTIFVLLFLAFGSVVVPLKAVLLNFLSLTATFGALVWVFQEGHLQG